MIYDIILPVLEGEDEYIDTVENLGDVTMDGQVMNDVGDTVDPYEEVGVADV